MGNFSFRKVFIALSEVAETAAIVWVHELRKSRFNGFGIPDNYLWMHLKYFRRS